MNHVINIGQLIAENNLYKLKSYFSSNNIQFNKEYHEGCFDLLIQSIEKNASDDIFKYILSFYKIVNFESINSKVPLFIAIEKEHFKQADILISYHADINYINKNKDNIITYLLNKKILTKSRLNYVLKNNINVNFKNRHGVRILETLIRNKNISLLNLIFKTLIFKNETVLRLINAHKYHLAMSKRQLFDFIEYEKSKIEITKPMFINAIKNTDKFVLNLLLEHEVNNYIFDITNGYNLLIEAVEQNNLPMVQFLIQKGVNVNEKNFKSSTPLIISAENGDKDIVEYLVEHGAQINERNADGETALKVSYTKWNCNIVKYLIEHGANINDTNHLGKTLLILAIEENQMEMIQYLLQHATLKIDLEDGLHWTALMYAAKQGNVQIIKRLLEQGANVKHCDSYGDTPLLIAAEYGQEDAVKFFIESKKADINETNHMGWTALMLASKSGNIPVIDYLIKMGANRKLRTKKGSSSLLIAVYYNHLPAVQYFIEHHSDAFNINEKKKNGNNLLIFAALNGNLEMTKYLISHNAHSNTASFKKSNALIQASYLGHLDIIKFLIEEGIDPCQKDRRGMSALHYSSRNGYQFIVQYLIEHQVNINETNDNLDTALIIACRWKRLEVIIYLVENGANINHQNKEGYTALIVATQKGYFDIAQYLVEHSADISLKTSNKWTALMWAAKLGNLQFIKFLVEKYQAEINEISDDGWSALKCAYKNSYFEDGTCSTYIAITQYLIDHHANKNERWEEENTPFLLAMNDSEDMVQFLIEHGDQIDINLSNDLGETALMRASVKGCLKIIHYLVDNGALIDIKDHQGNTPLMYAAKYGHTNVVQYFLEKKANIIEKNNNGETVLTLAFQGNFKTIIKLLMDEANQLSVSSFIEDDDWIQLINFAKHDKISEAIEWMNVKGITIYDTKNNYTLLTFASLNNCLHFIQKILEGKTPSEITELVKQKDHTELGWTPLMYAAYFGYLELTTYLIEQKALIDETDSEQFTPLLYATQNGHIELVNYLLQRGANGLAKNKFGRNGLMLASIEGHLNIVKRYLQVNKIDINDADGRRWTAILHASQHHHLPIVEYLFDHGADINKEAVFYWTPLLASAHQGYFDIVQFLVPRGAKLDQRCYSGSTPLIYSAQNGYLKIVQYLVEAGADINIDNNWNRTAMIEAISNDHIDIAIYLIEHGAQINNFDSYFSPLIIASKQGHESVVKYLIAHGAIVDTKKYNATPLKAASQHGHLNIVQFLIESGANINYNGYYNGDTPIMLAVLHNKYDVVKYLLQQGADTSEHKAFKGSVLSVANHYGFIRLYQLLKKYVKPENES